MYEETSTNDRLYYVGLYTKETSTGTARVEARTGQLTWTDRCMTLDLKHYTKTANLKKPFRKRV